ncbi:MAG: hypothetical protein JJE52_04055 [Acidimicrobiia bacterium]|nr:hypothetical protein [Acidimicrobiia bacterium]
MAQFLPDCIELTAREAFDMVAALQSAYEVLVSSEWVGIAIEIEQAHATLIAKLFPDDQE